MKSIVALVLALSAPQAMAMPLGDVTPQGLEPQAGYDFSGIVALSNCSGALVRFSGSLDTDRAMVLTNGHCIGGFTEPGKYVAGKSVARAMSVLGASGQKLGTVTADQIIYSTMTQTDMTLYRLDQTLGEVESKFKIKALVLAERVAQPGEEISIISGYWKKGSTCLLDLIVHTLREDKWTFKDSIRYGQGCISEHGMSGSPIVSSVTHEVVGVNNTNNDSGESCTMDNPCEVDAAGQVTVRPNQGYGQQIHWIYGCLNAARELELSRPGCELPH
jgi:hypothetical protein